MDVICVSPLMRNLRQIRSYFWSVFSCIRSEYRKIRTRSNSVFGHFSRCVVFSLLWPLHWLAWNLKTNGSWNFEIWYATVKNIRYFFKSFIAESFHFTEAVVWRCSVQKVLSKVSQNSRENTCARVSACNFIKKKTLALVFSCEFLKVLRTSFL